MRLLSFVALLLASSTVFAQSLAGRWEVQAMGADREISIKQQGQKFIAHRVMWPEFEGQKYKLEHLYRGTIIKGREIRGQLLVKEDELPKFEVLREFVGTIDASGEVILDGLPLKRLGDTTAPPEEPAVEPTRGNEAPALSWRESRNLCLLSCC